jgi:serine protease Do
MFNTILTDVAAELAAVADRLRQSTVKVTSRNLGIGTGLIWRSDGVIVTNAHVAVSDAIGVELADGRVFNAVRTHFDPQQDLAVLKIAAIDLPPVTIGDVATLRVGEVVLAVGHPFADNGAVTIGTVCSTDLRVIMADLQLYPGNSGGPLADCLGRVVGINTMIFNGLAVAIPISKLDSLSLDRAPETI